MCSLPLAVIVSSTLLTACSATGTMIPLVAAGAGLQFQVASQQVQQQTQALEAQQQDLAHQRATDYEDQRRQDQLAAEVAGLEAKIRQDLAVIESLRKVSAWDNSAVMEQTFQHDLERLRAKAPTSPLLVTAPGDLERLKVMYSREAWDKKQAADRCSRVLHTFSSYLSESAYEIGIDNYMSCRRGMVEAKVDDRVIATDDAEALTALRVQAGQVLDSIDPKMDPDEHEEGLRKATILLAEIKVLAPDDADAVHLSKRLGTAQRPAVKKVVARQASKPKAGKFGESRSTSLAADMQSLPSFIRAPEKTASEHFPYGPIYLYDKDMPSIMFKRRFTYLGDVYMARCKRWHSHWFTRPLELSLTDLAVLGTLTPVPAYDGWFIFETGDLKGAFVYHWVAFRARKNATIIMSAEAVSAGTVGVAGRTKIEEWCAAHSSQCAPRVCE